MLLSGFIGIGEYKLALKAALILYYLIEPTQVSQSYNNPSFKFSQPTDRNTALSCHCATRFSTLQNRSLGMEKLLIISLLQNPPTSRDERLETLQYLLLLVDYSGSKKTRRLRRHLYYHLRQEYVTEVEFCYGEDSIVAQYEKKEWDAVIAAELGGEVNTILGSEARSKFYEGMNKLLKLAGLPERTMKDMFWIDYE